MIKCYLIISDYSISPKGSVCSSELRKEIFVASISVNPVNSIMIPLLILNTSKTEVHLDTIETTLHISSLLTNFSRSLDNSLNTLHF